MAGLLISPNSTLTIKSNRSRRNTLRVMSTLEETLFQNQPPNLGKVLE
jgi:hypothetical protein